MKFRAVSLLVLFFLLKSLCFCFGNGVIINEFQASNVSTIVDDSLEYSDWIEIYNSSSQEVNLSGWALTDEKDQPQKWQFPDTTLQAGAYLLVWASNRDWSIAGMPLHTNFKLSASGEYLALFAPDGALVSVWNPYPAQRNDFSYGLLNGSWVIYAVPTPGIKNSETAVAQVPAPVFSQNHGFFENPFQLSMSCALPGAVLYYTTDGSTPAANNGTLYTTALTVTGTAIIRARAIKSPSMTDSIGDSPITTRTYLFASDILKQSNTPVGYPSNWGKYTSISGTSIADYEMDPELTALPLYDAKIRLAWKELPIVSLVTDKGNFFNNVNDSVTGGIYMFTGPPVGTQKEVGLGWERPVSFEYFFAKDTISLQVDCGIQLHGGHSRLPEKSPKHSFRLDFQSDYGALKLYYPLFGKSETRVFNSFFLRAGFGTSWIHQTAAERAVAIYTRDTWAKRTQRRMGELYTHTQYAHLFINGIYWGLYNPNERVDDDFCKTYLGGEKEDYDILKVEDDVQTVVATNGTLEAWDALIATVASATDPAIYQKIQGKNPDMTRNPLYPPLLDVQNYIDYMLLNLYGGNSDWDNHNWIAVRNRMNPEKGFQFLCWDSEKLMVSLSDNVTTKNNAKCPTYILQQLKNYPLFCRQFGDRAQKHCFGNGSLSPVGSAEIWNELAEKIDNSLYAESARWGDYRKDVHSWGSVGLLYRKEVDFEANKKYMLETYFPKRTDAFLLQLKAAGLFPSVDAPSFKVNGQALLSDSILEGDKVSLVVPAGTAYYTLDDSDPVVWSADGSGLQSASSIRYSTTFSPEKNVNVKVRALYQGVWSALNEQPFLVRITTDLQKETHLLAQVDVGCTPNPFRDQTTFRYTVPVGSNVRLEVLDLSGRKISTLINQYQEAGTYHLPFDGSALTAGVYVCRLEVRGALNHQVVMRLIKW